MFCEDGTEHAPVEEQPISINPVVQEYAVKQVEKENQRGLELPCKLNQPAFQRLHSFPIKRSCLPEAEWAETKENIQCQNFWPGNKIAPR